MEVDDYLLFDKVKQLVTYPVGIIDTGSNSFVPGLELIDHIEHPL